MFVCYILQNFCQKTVTDTSIVSRGLSYVNCPTGYKTLIRPSFRDLRVRQLTLTVSSCELNKPVAFFRNQIYRNWVFKSRFSLHASFFYNLTIYDSSHLNPKSSPCSTIVDSHTFLIQSITCSILICGFSIYSEIIKTECEIYESSTRLSLLCFQMIFFSKLET